MSSDSPEKGNAATPQAGAATSAIPAGASANDVAPSGAQADTAPVQPAQGTTSAGAEAAKPADGDLQKVLADVAAKLDPGNTGRFNVVIQNLTYNNDYTQGDSFTYDVDAGRDVGIRLPNPSGPPGSALPSADRFAGDFLAWWDSGTPSHRDLCRLIAIAALEGANFGTISGHAGQLLTTIGRGKDSPDADEPRLDTVGRVLTRLGAYRAWKEDAGKGERGRREVVFFEAREWREHCLIGAWQELETLGAPLAEWLVDVALRGAPAARAPLQEAIAILFAHDPEAVFATVIRPLSDGSIPQRWVAANALASAAAGKSAPTVIAKLKTAAHLSYGRGSASVAALCVVNAFGKRWPGEAADLLLALLEHWRRIDAALGMAMDGLVRQSRRSAEASCLILMRLSQWKHWDEIIAARVESREVPREIRHILQGPPRIATTGDAMRHIKQLAARDGETSGPSEHAVETAKLVALVSAAILDTSADKDVDAQDGEEAPTLSCVATYAARDGSVANAASKLLLQLLRFGPAKQTAWSLIREMLRWSNAEKAAGSVAILRALSQHVTQDEGVRLGDHLKHWARDPTIRKTIEMSTRAASPA